MSMAFPFVNLGGWKLGLVVGEPHSEPASEKELVEKEELEEISVGFCSPEGEDPIMFINPFAESEFSLLSSRRSMEKEFLVGRDDAADRT